MPSPPPKLRPKVYFYTDAEVGTSWPGEDHDRHISGDFPEPRFKLCEFPGFTRTDDPTRADVFVCCQRLAWLSDEQIRGLPYLRGNERRHVFFGLGPDANRDCYRTWPDIPAIFIRATCNQDVLAANPTTVSWPWPHETADMVDYVRGPDDGFEYDVVFQGCANNDLGRRAVESVRRTKLKTHIQVNPAWWPDMKDRTEQARLRRTYLETLSKARLHLVPTAVQLDGRLMGQVRYRLYEGMYLGVVGVHLCDGCVLPFGDKIDWDSCVASVKEQHVDWLGEIVGDWLARHSDDEIRYMGQYARQAWARWIDRRRWAENVSLVVRERLGL
jgi:hypothetical protein